MYFSFNLSMYLQFLFLLPDSRKRCNLQLYLYRHFRDFDKNVYFNVDNGFKHF